MPLSRDFKETVRELMQARPGLAKAMLREGIDALVSGEFEVGKSVLRDYINATIGFGRLSKKTRIPAKSLMRMLAPGGNPQSRNLVLIVDVLQREAGIELHVVEAAE